MTRRVIIGAIVVLAVALVLWLKPSTSTNDTTEAPDSELPSVTSQVLLFADPREAESSCGCGQIIRMVREADVPGVVAVQEFDPQHESEAVRVHAVRVVPTVIIAGGDGVEQTRFEGESPDIIASLRDALAVLSSETAPGG